jgi:hypothetical protein
MNHHWADDLIDGRLIYQPVADWKDNHICSLPTANGTIQ